MHQHLHGLGGRLPLEFDTGSQSLLVGARGPLIIDVMDMTILATIDGMGLAFSLEEHVAPHVASGALARP
jgi:hypothetical protein